MGFACRRRKPGRAGHADRRIYGESACVGYFSELRQHYRPLAAASLGSGTSLPLVASVFENGPSQAFTLNWNLTNDDGEEVRNGP